MNYGTSRKIRRKLTKLMNENSKIEITKQTVSPSRWIIHSFSYKFRSVEQKNNLKRVKNSFIFKNSRLTDWPSDRSRTGKPPSERAISPKRWGRRRRRQRKLIRFSRLVSPELRRHGGGGAGVKFSEGLKLRIISTNLEWNFPSGKSSGFKSKYDLGCGVGRAVSQWGNRDNA